GTIGVDGEGRVRRVADRFNLGGECRAGIYAWANVLSSRAFDTLPERESFNHLDGWWVPELAWGAAAAPASGADASDCTWEPVGTPAEYLAVNLELCPLSYLDLDEAMRRAGATLLRDADGAPSVRLGAGARLGPRARLSRAVVWEDESVPQGFAGEGGGFGHGAFHSCEPPPPAATT